MRTNVDSTINFINQFLPLLSKEGRVVIISSEQASLRVQPKKIASILSNPKITEEDILTLSR
jgi:NAD(P)-dependent dehydrogenase (short-subunit alcohol dehydrogenase family)